MTIGLPTQPVAIEDLAEPIVAYRKWNLTGRESPIAYALFPRKIEFPWDLRNESDGWLYSTNKRRHEPWAIDGITADCGVLPRWLAEKIGRQSPCLKHENPLTKAIAQAPLCGIYAFKHLHRAVFGWQGNILGEVLLGGRVVPHEAGYRAEKAKISKIFITQRAPIDGFDRYEAISKRYHVPIEFIGTDRIYDSMLKKQEEEA